MKQQHGLREHYGQWRSISSALLVLLLLINATGFAQEGSSQEVLVAGAAYVSSSPPLANYVYDTLRSRRISHFSGGQGVLQPAGESTLFNVRVKGKLVVGEGFEGVVTNGPYTQFIDLDEAGPSSPDSAALVHSIEVADRITMGADDAGFFGKHVYDVAESIAARAAAAADVVIISPDEDITVEPSSRAYDTRVAGVISTAPKMHLGPDKTKQPLALAGVVLCKVSTENGPITPGDLLVTSSRLGHAMRADSPSVKPGMLVGRALEPLAQGTGTINILINQ